MAGIKWSLLNYSRRGKRSQSAAGAGTRRTQTSPKSRRADGEMGRRSTTVTGSAQTSSHAATRTDTPKTVTKKKAVTGSETRTKTREEPKTGTRRRTERGKWTRRRTERGKRTRRETKTEKRQETEILTETEKETRRNEETKNEKKTGRDKKRGKRGTKVERVATARYAAQPHTHLKF